MLKCFRKVSQKRRRWHFLGNFGGGQNGKVHVHSATLTKIIIFVHAPFTINWTFSALLRISLQGESLSFLFWKVVPKIEICFHLLTQKIQSSKLCSNCTGEQLLATGSLFCEMSNHRYIKPVDCTCFQAIVGHDQLLWLLYAHSQICLPNAAYYRVKH